MAYRVRNWCWLARVIRLAGCQDALQLLDLRERHPLRRELQHLNAFRAVLQDGSDPGIVLAVAGGKDSIRTHVDQIESFRAATADYGHLLWERMHERCVFEKDDEWLDSKLRALGLVKINSADKNNAGWLGLNDNEWLGSETHDTRELTVDWQQFISLDGILLLALLASKAHAVSHHAQASHLLQAARSASQALGFSLAFERVAHDSWIAVFSEFLSVTRWPEKPTVDEVDVATRQLQSESAAELGPDASRSIREGRRYSHALEARIRANRFAGGVGFFDYRSAAPLWGWLVEHREMLSTRVSVAVEQAMGLPAEKIDMPDPIRMPEAIYQRRKRPLYSDLEWRVFGDQLPYDLVPVEVV
jgi:hypothetical protein